MTVLNPVVRVYRYRRKSCNVASSVDGERRRNPLTLERGLPNRKIPGESRLPTRAIHDGPMALDLPFLRTRLQLKGGVKLCLGSRRNHIHYRNEQKHAIL